MSDVHVSLSAKTALVDKRFVGAVTATFSRMSDDSSVADIWLTMATDEWVAMGRPDHLTITIKPGDLLNNPEAPNG